VGLNPTFARCGEIVVSSMRSKVGLVRARMRLASERHAESAASAADAPRCCPDAARQVKRGVLTEQLYRHPIRASGWAATWDRRWKISVL